MLKKIIFFLILNVGAFAFKIDNLDFDGTMGIGSKESKSYVLTNTKNFPLRYRLNIEGNPENIVVSPKTIIVPPHSEKSFSIVVTGKKEGENHYFLILEEEGLNLENKGSFAKLKMKYRIEQKYWVK